MDFKAIARKNFDLFDDIYSHIRDYIDKYPRDDKFYLLKSTLEDLLTDTFLYMEENIKEDITQMIRVHQYLSIPKNTIVQLDYVDMMMYDPKEFVNVFTVRDVSKETTYKFPRRAIGYYDHYMVETYKNRYGTGHGLFKTKDRNFEIEDEYDPGLIVGFKGTEKDTIVSRIKRNGRISIGHRQSPRWVLNEDAESYQYLAFKRNTLYFIRKVYEGKNKFTELVEWNYKNRTKQVVDTHVDKILIAYDPTVNVMYKSGNKYTIIRDGKIKTFEDERNIKYYIEGDILVTKTQIIIPDIDPINIEYDANTLCLIKKNRIGWIKNDQQFIIKIKSIH